MTIKLKRTLLWAMIAATIMLSAAPPAWAQYGTSFYYYNRRTGRAYSQQVYAGRGAAFGGFSYSRPGRDYAASSGYAGRRYYSQQFYGSPSRSYGYRSYYGR